MIKHYIGEVESFDNFITVIDKLAGILKSYGWITLAKKHPLETVTPTFSNVTIVPQDTHFLDLIEACDASALINSGVGVYSMMAEKPCYIFGESFYHVPEVNYQVSNEQYNDNHDLSLFAEEIAIGKKINKENMLNFINFLVGNLYSFGKSKTMIRKEKDGSLRTITTGIDFYDVKINGKQLFQYAQDDTPQLSLSAPLFERFGLDLHDKRQGKKPPTMSVKAPAVVPVKATTGAAVTQLEKPMLAKQTMQESLDKKIKMVNKLRKKPYEFFNDSKVKSLKKLRVLFE